MMAIANCVKPLAVPGPPPGPCEAKAAVADNEVTRADAKASCDSPSLVRDDAMTISCDAKFSEDTDDSLFRF
jgi:hypothetical protein